MVNPTDKGRETYGPGETNLPDGFVKRTTSIEGAFFLPHLRSGMNLLDCGCGPGSITLGMAEVVVPGRVVGIDIQPGQVETATALSAEKGLTNASFEVGDIYNLPFPDGSFDAVFANGTLMHLKEPLRALKEMHRVLKPGGVAGVRDMYLADRIWVPKTPLLEEAVALLVRIGEFNGIRLDYPPLQRQFLVEAGFARPEASADAQHAGTLENARTVARTFAGLLGGPNMRRVAMEQGWADEAHLEVLREELLAWGEKPDALYVAIWCSAVGWKPEK